MIRSQVYQFTKDDRSASEKQILMAAKKSVNIISHLYGFRYFNNIFIYRNFVIV
jgi:hypothetical protein